MYTDLQVKCPFVFSDFNTTWIIFDRISKNTQKPNFIKIRPVIAELFHVYGQADLTKLIASSSSVALQPGVCLGLLYNTPPSLSIPRSLSPFVYSHLSQVRGHVIQPSHFCSSSSSCCIQLSVHLFFGIAVSCILSIWPSHHILWHLMNLAMFSPWL